MRRAAASRKAIKIDAVAQQCTRFNGPPESGDRRRVSESRFPILGRCMGRHHHAPPEQGTAIADITGFAQDSSLEESGFEPSVPLSRKFLPGCCRREIPERLAGVPY